jgi:uncharacterized protein YkwD
MRYLLILTGIFVFTLQAKTPIGKVFDCNLGESVLGAKINQFRTQMGLKPLYISTKVSASVSKRNSSLMALGQRLYHPTFDWRNDKILSKKVADIYKDYRIINKAPNTNPGRKKGYILSYGEVAAGGINPARYKTYESLADAIIQGWYNSDRQRAVIFSNDTAKAEEKSFLGVSYSLDIHGNFYAAAHILSFTEVEIETPIGNVFNKKFADSLLFERINQKRIELGYTPFHKSALISEYISDRNVKIMISQRRLHHPKFDWENSADLTQKTKEIAREYIKVNPNCLAKRLGDRAYANISYTEVAINGTKSDTYGTYERLINLIVEGWYNSPPHRGILLSDDFGKRWGETSMFGVSVRMLGQNEFYAASNVIRF